MPRAPNKKAEEAFALYEQGLKLIEIANKLHVPAGTVRRWKCTNNWNSISERSQKTDKRSKKNKERSQKKEKVIAKEVEQVINNPDLTDKQRLFCLYYVRCFNATKACQRAYGCSYESAMAEGSKLLKNSKINTEIQRLKKERFNREFLSEEDIFQKYIDIAFSDVTMYVNFGEKTIETEGGSEKANYINLKESYEVDGTLITEIAQSREGIKIKLADKMKALQWLSDHMNLATEEQKAKINLLKQQAGTDENKEIQIYFQKVGDKNKTS